MCFQYQAKEVTDSDDEDDEDDEDDDDDDDANASEPVYGAPQRVCDSCFFCCILAPMVAWAHGHPVDGFVPSSELDETISTIRGITTIEGVSSILHAPAHPRGRSLEGAALKGLCWGLSRWLMR